MRKMFFFLISRWVFLKYLHVLVGIVNMNISARLVSDVLVGIGAVDVRSRVVVDVAAFMFVLASEVLSVGSVVDASGPGHAQHADWGLHCVEGADDLRGRNTQEGESQLKDPRSKSKVTIRIIVTKAPLTIDALLDSGNPLKSSRRS